MPVYVDDLMNYPTEKSMFKRSCHMIANSEEDLVAFGERIGLKRAWLQDAGTYRAHFDLTPGMRIKAVKAGAVEVTCMRLVEILRQMRQETQPVSICVSCGREWAGSVIQCHACGHKIDKVILRRSAE